MQKGYLILENGQAFPGVHCGAEADTVGELVFTTGMNGYIETLTDPSYCGQIVLQTFPLIGNYGIIPADFEGKCCVRGYVVREACSTPSNFRCAQTLDAFLKENNIPGITGIDTRELTKVLREHGVMMGKIVFDDDPDNQPEARYEGINYVDKVSCKEVIRYNEGADKKKVVLVDCGVKTNIIRCLLKRGVEVIRVPWNYDFTGMEYDGLFISNGPGDPDTCDEAVQNIRKAMALSDKPIFGICMGNQLLSKAGGATIYKLKYGHRSHNQPVRMVGTERCFITSQNHGYAVDNNTLGNDWEPLFINMNDGSNEGIRHKFKPWFSAQFHPEAASGPTDTEFLFDEFVKLL